jgi:hypothetical protein
VTGDPIGAALHAEAEEARAEIRAAGLICPSCGVNMADLPADHRLEIGPLSEGVAKCADGKQAHLTQFDDFKAAVNISLYDDFRERESEAFARIIGKRAPGHEFTGILDVLGGQP